MEAKQLTQTANPFAQPRQLEIGAKVLARHYRPGHSPWLPGSIATRSQSGLHYEVQVLPGILWRRRIDQLRSTSIAPVPLEHASEPALVPAQEEERGNAKAEVQATLSFQPPATGNEQLRSEVPPTPTSPAPVENQAAATTPAPTAERRYPQLERRAPH